jgi:hypothetical protein
MSKELTINDLVSGQCQKQAEQDLEFTRQVLEEVYNQEDDPYFRSMLSEALERLR